MIGNPIGYPIGGVENLALGNTGVVDVTLDDATLSASSALAISGQETTTLDDATLVATGLISLGAILASIRAGGHINSPCNDGHGLVRMKAYGGKR